MKLSQKRTCKDCKAVTTGIGGTSVDRCFLGYDTKSVSAYNDFIITMIPTEPCPKPSTYRELFLATHKGG